MGRDFMDGDGLFFSIQPDWCRNPLPTKDLTDCGVDVIEWEKRVLFYDPTEVYNRVKHVLNPYHRSPLATMSQLFPSPKDKTLCSCGCGKQAQQNKRWASDECWEFANAVYCIIAGVPAIVAKFLRMYHGEVCSECGSTHNGVEADYIQTVSNGGGGSWLSNYKPICFLCYNKKYPKPVKNTKVWVKPDQKAAPKIETKVEVKKQAQKAQMKMEFLSIEQMLNSK